MGKRQTISQRWYEWNSIEPWWSIPCLFSFIGSVVFLGVHLGADWIFPLIGHPELVGVGRTIGLCGLIGLASVTETILFFRAKKLPTLWWWFWFHTYVVIGVVGWEIASYFFGSQR